MTFTLTLGPRVFALTMTLTLVVTMAAARCGVWWIPSGRLGLGLGLVLRLGLGLGLRLELGLADWVRNRVIIRGFTSYDFTLHFL